MRLPKFLRSPASVLIVVLALGCLLLGALSFHLYGGLALLRIPDIIIRIADLVALLLTVISLVFAVLALKDGRRLSEKLEESAKLNETNMRGMIASLDVAGKVSRASLDKAEEITKSLTTRFIGHFPEYLPEIARLIDQSKRFLWILATVPSHGLFTDPNGWEEISLAIRRKLHVADPSFQAILVHGTDEKVRENYEDLYSTLSFGGNSWESWRDNQRSKIAALTKSATSPDRTMELTFDSFLKARVSQDMNELKSTYRDVSCYAGDQIYPLYCWITDAGAIFSVRTENQQEGAYSGSAVLTRDPYLMDALRTTFEGWLQRTEKYQSEKEPIRLLEVQPPRLEGSSKAPSTAKDFAQVGDPEKS